MKQKVDIEQRVEQALNSLDGIQQAGPKDWFFTRLNAKLQKEEKSVWASIASFLAKPQVAIAGVCTILVLNVVFLLGQQQENVSSTATIHTEVGTDNESIIASNSSFDYENIVQP